MADTTTPVDPLLPGVAIVNEDGVPTEYFSRQWDLQKGVDENTNSIAEETNLTAEQVEAIQAINLVAGTGLEGGGTLSGDDITFALEDTNVTPGTYGDASNVAQVTVDQQGRITEIAQVAISGGGGGGDQFAWVAGVNNAFSGTAYAWKGVYIRPLLNLTITSIHAFIATVDTHTYQAAVYRLDGSDDIDQITGISATQASPGTFASGVNLTFPLTSSASLSAGSSYVVVMGRVDGADAYALPISTATLADNLVPFPAVPTELYVESASQPGAFIKIEQATPDVGDAVIVDTSNASQYGIGLSFSL